MCATSTRNLLVSISTYIGIIKYTIVTQRYTRGSRPDGGPQLSATHYGRRHGSMHTHARPSLALCLLRCYLTLAEQAVV